MSNMIQAGTDKKLALPAFFILLILAVLCAFFVFFIRAIPLDDSSPESSISTDTALLALSGQTMGTRFHILLHQSELPTQVQRQTLENSINDRLYYLDKDIFSTYAAQSQLSLLNASAPGADVNISFELVTALALAQEVYIKSSGAFDITIKPLVDLWGFGVLTSTQIIPEPATIAHAMSALGMDEITLGKHGDKFSVSKSKAVIIDLSALAKGYAVDQVGELLDALGVQNYLIEIGGELLSQGRRPDGKPWRIGIEKPRQGPPEMFQQINSSRQKLAVATSGNYQNYFTHQGQHYSHIINPHTGWPVRHELASVTVIGNTTISADAWATALLVLGLEEGMKLANDLQLAAFFIVKNNAGFEAHYSGAFVQYL